MKMPWGLGRVFSKSVSKRLCFERGEGEENEPKLSIISQKMLIKIDKLGLKINLSSFFLNTYQV